MPVAGILTSQQIKCLESSTPHKPSITRCVCNHCPPPRYRLFINASIYDRIVISVGKWLPWIGDYNVLYCACKAPCNICRPFDGCLWGIVSMRQYNDDLRMIHDSMPGQELMIYIMCIHGIKETFPCTRMRMCLCKHASMQALCIKMYGYLCF